MSTRNDDRQMQRGLSQALYKYLPHSWIDFFQKSDRVNYTAYVTHWNSETLTGINNRRLLDRVNQAVMEFFDKNNIIDFSLPINEEHYKVLTPRAGINSDVLAEISPLTFFCSSCHKVHTFSSSAVFLRNLQRPKCTVCRGNLRQLQLVFSCKCGYTDPVKARPCPTHQYESLYYNGKFMFTCSKDHLHFDIRKQCPSCNNMLYPQNALDSRHFIPKNLTMVDLLNSEEEQFIFEQSDGAAIFLGHWLGELDRDTFKTLLQSKGGADKGAMEQQIKEQAKMFMEDFGQDEETALKMASAAFRRTHKIDSRTKAVDYIQNNLNNLNDNYLKEQAMQLVEYHFCLHPERDGQEALTVTLEQAAKTSLKLNTVKDSGLYLKCAKDFGFRHVQATGNLPFVMCSYGFTRQKNEPSEAKLVAFPQEGSKKNVYAAKLSTEGIIFELDRKRVIEWLLENRFIQLSDVPENLDDDKALKAWFLNHVNPSVVPTFQSISNEYTVTRHVFNLIHSISHALLKEAAHLSGLDKNSMSEYIFPNVPGFLIYCQNSQGSNIGALFNLFEAYFDRWLKSAKATSEQCIFDPVCTHRDHACSGCLYLNEISCVHFNKDLDRRYLVGAVDLVSDERIIGFWEGLKWQ